MKILAVSDIQSRILENLVTNSSEKLRDINVILSCGDLNCSYVEFLVDGLNRDLFFVQGNHKLEDEPDDEDIADRIDRIWNRVRPIREKLNRRIAGQLDLHGRVETFGPYLIAGFGGAMWYNGRKNQFTEPQMGRIVRAVERKIQWHRLQEKIFGLPRKDVIVISHAPVLNVHDQPDACHTGFKCFRSFIRTIAPILWVHGHVHLPDLRQNQISIVDSTTVVNAYGCKYIKIDQDHIHVSSRYDD